MVGQLPAMLASQVGLVRVPAVTFCETPLLMHTVEDARAVGEPEEAPTPDQTHAD